MVSPVDAPLMYLVFYLIGFQVAAYLFKLKLTGSAAFVLTYSVLYLILGIYYFVRLLKTTDIELGEIFIFVISGCIILSIEYSKIFFKALKKKKT